MKLQQSSNMDFMNTTYSEKLGINTITALYNRNDDEPDFDCEFLYGEVLNESILDPEQDDDFKDDYNDNEWDTNIYDPYMEQTYY
ncbi:MAG: hypothetical protein EOO44_12080 [Flavobacterium sp.]|nr:MAG: hypothetical protein EOO44_12080 [Flavobacterium sp.]